MALSLSAKESGPFLAAPPPAPPPPPQSPLDKKDGIHRKKGGFVERERAHLPVSVRVPIRIITNANIFWREAHREGLHGKVAKRLFFRKAKPVRAELLTPPRASLGWYPLVARVSQRPPISRWSPRWTLLLLQSQDPENLILRF